MDKVPGKRAKTEDSVKVGRVASCAFSTAFSDSRQKLFVCVYENFHTSINAVDGGDLIWEWDLSQPENGGDFGVWRRAYRATPDERSMTQEALTHPMGFRLLSVGSPPISLGDIDVAASDFSFCSCQSAECGCAGYNIVRNNCRTFVDFVLGRLGVKARCSDFDLHEGSSSLPRLVLGWASKAAQIAAADAQREKDLAATTQLVQQAANGDKPPEKYSWGDVLGKAGVYLSTAVATSLQERALVAVGAKKSQQQTRQFEHGTGAEVLLRQLNAKTWLVKQ